MAVAGVRVEGDVGDEAKLGKLALDRAAGAADEVAFVESFAPLRVLERNLGVGEEGNRRNLRLTARSASRTASSTVSRSTPGIAATGTRRSVPSMRKSGQMRSLAVSTCSATSRRAHSALRLRRGRWVRSSRWVSAMRDGLFIGLLLGPLVHPPGGGRRRACGLDHGCGPDRRSCSCSARKTLL